MFGLGTWELLLILVLALLLFGPERLPRLARSIGKAFHELKRSTEQAKHALDQELTEPQASKSAKSDSFADKHAS